MKKAEKRKLENDFLKSYLEGLENLKSSDKKLVELGILTKEEAQNRRRAYELAKAKEAQTLEIIPSHEIYVKWDSAFKDGVTVRLPEFIRLIEIRDLIEFRELLGLEDQEVNVGIKYFDEKFIKILVERLGSEDAATGYLMAILKAVKFCEDETVAEKILMAFLEEAKISNLKCIPVSDKKRERTIRSLNERLEKIYQK